MNKLLTVEDIAARYQCSTQTARKYMRGMIHMEHPLMVSEAAVTAWEQERTVYPVAVRQRRAVAHRVHQWIPGTKIPMKGDESA